jgi:hypothetical protein
MSLAVEQPMRAWTNAQPGLTGEGNPLANGCFLDPPISSPAEGAWALLSRAGSPAGPVVAEDGAVTTARIQWDIYSPDEVCAENAAAALATCVEGLSGKPQPAGDLTALVHDNLAGPVFVPQPDTAGEPYCFQVQADILLTAI